MTYEKKKTQREINVENIPDEHAIVRRFFIGVFYVVSRYNMHGFRTFCELHGMDTANMDRLIREPHKKFYPKYLTILVKEYDFSAHWLITGEGPMILEKKENA